MSFLDKTGLQTLTNKLVQGDAIKVASHRGHTVKNVIDNIQRECDNVANPLEYKIENRVADFKIGKGRDVDVSGDVENGYTEVELQGKTYHNLMTTNLTNFIQSSDFAKGFKKSYDFSANKTYTLIVHTGVVNNLNRPVCFARFHGLNSENKEIQLNVEVNNQIKFQLESNKLYVGKFTTPSYWVSDKDIQWLIWDPILDKSKGEYIEIKYAYLIEGDYTQTPAEELPKYFEGIKSSFEDGIVDVEVIGKNLFNKDKHLFNISIGSTTGKLWGVGKGGNRYSVKIPCEPNTTYSISKVGGDRFGIWTHSEDFNENAEIELDTKVTSIDNEKRFTFKTNSTAKVMCIYVSLNEEAKNIQVEKSNISTSYEPYNKKKISFNIGEPLRSLPNGVCDEIRNNNGQWELVRRVCKMVLDGTQPVGSMDEYCGIKTSTTLFRIGQNMYGIKKGGTPISDRFSYDRSAWVNDFPSICCVEKSLDIRILKTSLEGFDDSLDSTQKSIIFKNYLSQNPTTTYFELENPTITPIVPIEFDVKPLASMSINSEISPTSNHSVVLNRAGQIERAICDIAELKNRVEALETIYDTTFLETQHKLSLLEMDYELEGGSV